MTNRLDDWLFHYSSFRNTWQAVKIEHFFELFNGDKGNIIRSSSRDTLEELIILTGGDKIKINELLNKQ